MFDMAAQLHSWTQSSHPTPDSHRRALRGVSAVPSTAPRGIALAPLASAGPHTTAAHRSQQLRRLGLRVTASRLGVLSIFEESSQALSGEQMYALLAKRGIDSSVGTVYRCIHEFEDRGVICREGTPGRKARYRLQRQSAAGPRLRFICGRCGHDREVLDADLHERLLAAATQAGAPLNAQALTLTLQGLCEGRCPLQR